MDPVKRKIMINRLTSIQVNFDAGESDKKLEAVFRSFFGTHELEQVLTGNASVGKELIVNVDDADTLRLCSEVRALVQGASDDALAKLGDVVLGSIKKTLAAALAANNASEFDGYSLNDHFDQAQA
jgi:hypothetical protein